jgi:hypothetical protein
MSAIALRQRRDVASLGSSEARDRSVRRRVGAAWALLYFNTLTFIPGGIVHIPSHVGKALSQGALPLALLVILTVNPKARLRPNVFLCLVCLLVIDTFITVAAAPHLGELLRTLRLAGFVVGLWLLTPWWGRDDMLLLRYHLRCLYVSLGSVLLGLMIDPHRALAFGGRLSGVVWPMAATQVAQYGAVTAGLTVVLWLTRLVSGRLALAGVTFATAILLLTHTRTALAGMILGILVAGVSLFAINARVRKFFAAGAAAVSTGIIAASGLVLSYLERGQNATGLEHLTGRTNQWALVLNTPRTKFQEVFGFGLSNASINGGAIDSNWLSGYMQEGIFGVVICAIVLVWLAVAACFQPRGARRALVLFIVTYCTVASFTEDSFTDVSTYLLHLTVAASLLIAPLTGWDIFTRSRRPGGGQAPDGKSLSPAGRAAADLVH